MYTWDENDINDSLPSDTKCDQREITVYTGTLEVAWSHGIVIRRPNVIYANTVNHQTVMLKSPAMLFPSGNAVPTAKVSLGTPLPPLSTMLMNENYWQYKVRECSFYRKGQKLQIFQNTILTQLFKTEWNASHQSIHEVHKSKLVQSFIPKKDICNTSGSLL